MYEERLKGVKCEGMAFDVIRGTLHIKGDSADGELDPVHVDDEDTWERLSGPSALPNGRRHAQVRLEGIGTAETHYQG